MARSRSSRGDKRSEGAKKAQKAAKAPQRRSAPKLIIVESPAKARTIQQIVGKEFAVESTMGHIMDLPERKFGVDVDNGFEPEYVVRPQRKEVIKRLREVARQAEEIFLASDPDREGEAIAWHVAQVVRRPDAKRIEFHEITKPAVLRALEHPRTIDENLVNAQQARRVLDRIFGYTLSPLLWQKVKRNLSAGRVQSVALRLVVEREREIQTFIPQEYWTITATLTPQDEEAPFTARLIQIGDRKVTTPERTEDASDENVDRATTAVEDDKAIVIQNQTHAQMVVALLETARYAVQRVARGERKRTPPPPFITSTLQQVASRRLGFSPTRTMRVAQQLYEGVDLGNEGTVGLITYMRTDSPRVSDVAQEQAREFIRQHFGESFLPTKPRQYKARKSAQEAHEAIRPTSVFRTPEQVRPYLDDDQFALYALIWRRFVASQMADALYDTLTVEVAAHAQSPTVADDCPKWLQGVTDFLLRATGQALRFAGWLAVYGSDEDDSEAEGINIPDLEEGELLRLLALTPQQHFTKPPARYTQATLVKALEELGIGRPSTYAPTVDTILKRGYVALQGKQLVPTPLGVLVCDRLVQFFPNLLSVGFTAQMEERLDEVEEGKRDWRETVRYFYEPFKEALEHAQQHMDRAGDAPTDQKCPLCGATMHLKVSAYGPFLACARYPECRALLPLEEGATKTCPRCGGVMVRRGNNQGHYFVCLRYPDCPSVEAGDGFALVNCPECSEGVLLPKTVRKGRMKGRVFFSCSRYPQCQFATWDRPTEHPCPHCGSPLAERRSRNGATTLVCLRPDCDFVQDTEIVTHQTRESPSEP